VACLNPDMWSELFLENKDNLTEKLCISIKHLQAYREARKSDDASALRALLEDGRRVKEEVDGV